MTSNGHRPDLDLSPWIDLEPLEIKYGDKTYHASFDMPSVLHERIAAWCIGLLSADEDTAEAESVRLTARALSIDEAEAATISQPARKRLLGFLVGNPLTSPATTQ